MTFPTLGSLIISIIIFIIIDEAQTVSIDQRIDCDPGQSGDHDRCWSRGCVFDNMSLELKHVSMDSQIFKCKSNLVKPHGTSMLLS
jgi:hypothetical protein